MITVLFETSVLSGGHAHRGIGTYARYLLEELEKFPDVSIYKSTNLEKNSSIKPNLVHYPFFDLFFNTLPFSPLQKKVVTIHDVIPLLYPEYYKPGIKGSIRFQKQALALKTTNAIITDSECSKKDIMEHLQVPEKKIYVVPLASNPEITKQPDAAIQKVRRLYKVPSTYLLYVGDINYNKNIPQLIKMLKFLPRNIKLVCVGRNFKPQDIPEWRWIEAQMALSAVEKRVVFIPELLTDATADLAALYSGALAYVQPSLYEGFGLPVLEAMSCQTPVICAPTSSLPEVAGEHAVFSTDTRAESLAEAVLETLEWSQTRRNTHLRKAAAHAKSFSWQETARLTLEVYREVLK